MEIGDYLCNDGTFCKEYNESVIGIVYWFNNSKCKIVSLRNVDKKELIWGRQFNVNKTYSTIDGFNEYGYLPRNGSYVYPNVPHIVFNDIFIGMIEKSDGFEMSKTIALKGSKYSAAYKCNQYGNSAWDVGKPGCWYLPSIGELILIYKAHGLCNNTDIDYLSKDGFDSMKEQYFWSCTEYSNLNAYRLYFFDGSIINYNKYNPYDVRPVLELKL